MPVVLPLQVGDGLHRLYLFDDQSVFYAPQTQLIIGLDTAATWTILALDQGLPIDEETPGISAIRQLWEWGTIDQIPTPPVYTPLPTIQSVTNYKDGIRLKVLNKCFLVRGAELFCQMLAPFLVDSKIKPEIIIDIENNNDGFYLVFNGKRDPTFLALHPDQLLPALIDSLRRFSHEDDDYLLRMHAAVVSNDNCGLLLPAASGWGKSTLTAALMARGWRVLSDELAVISAKNGEALSIPFPINIKSTSIPVLRDDYPDIEQLPLYRYVDKRVLGYLPLKSHCFIPAGHSCSITHIVFPSYQPMVKQAVLKPIGPVEVLRRLATDGYKTQQPLNVENVEILLNWLQERPAYSLMYGSTHGALTMLTEI